MKKITVEVWSDFVCPWCWIAKKRLEQAIDASGTRSKLKSCHAHTAWPKARARSL